MALPARVVGVIVLVGALSAGMRPLVRIPKAHLAIATGFFEVVGILCFALGARDGIAVTSVVSSQFAALSVVGAYILFHEHLRRRQVVGVAILAAGVAMVALGAASPAARRAMRPWRAIWTLPSSISASIGSSAV